MKKTILLLASSCIAGFTWAQDLHTNAQEAKQTIAPANAQHLPSGSKHEGGVISQPQQVDVTGARTTTGGSRWYNYVDFYLDPYQTSISHGTNFISPTIWADTTALLGYTGTFSSPYYPYEFNTQLSMGLGLNPTWSYWNYADGTSSSTYPVDWSTAIGVRPTDAYTIDSLFIVGWYTRSTIGTPAKLNVVDTLIVTLVQGNGSSTGDMPAATLTGTVVPSYCPTCLSLSYQDVFHDTTTHLGAAHYNCTPLTVPSSAVYKFLLYGTDSNALAPNNSTFPRPATVARPRPIADPVINYSVSAGNNVAAIVEFKSGDPAYHATGGHPGDTVRLSDGTSITSTKYNYYNLYVAYAATASGGTTPEFCSACYSDPMFGLDNQAGYFDIEGNGWPHNAATYYPNWDIITSLSPLTANEHQFPRIGFHVQCSTCPTLPFPALGVNSIKAIDNVKAYPNPADNTLMVSYTGSATAVNITLTNVLGQVVASQNNVNGKATFNVSALPAGLYVYTLRANGEQTTGNVTIAH